MSKPSLLPLDLADWRDETETQSLAPVIPLRSIEGAPVLVEASAGAGGLGIFHNDPDSSDRRLIDALVVVALIISLHATIIDRFQHLADDEPVAPPKPPEVQISLIRPQPKVEPPPPPPPPPPKVQPKQVQAPVKNAIPLKPVKPKKIVEPVDEPPIQSNLPVADNAPPLRAPVAAPQPVEEKVTQPGFGAGYLNNPQPQYPEDAIDRGWTGTVTLKVHVMPDGKPDAVEVAKSSGHDLLDSAAVRTVKKSWSFVPAKRGNTPIAGWVSVPITFRL